MLETEVLWVSDAVCDGDMEAERVWDADADAVADALRDALAVALLLSDVDSDTLRDSVALWETVPDRVGASDAVGRDSEVDGLTLPT